MFQLGWVTGFDSEPDLPIDQEKRLGHSIDKRRWVGDWGSDGRESTDWIDQAIIKLRGEEYDPARLEETHLNVLEILASLEESLKIIEEAAFNKNLNLL